MDALAGLNPEQAEAVRSDAQHVAIIAGAGSGKTRVLTRRIAHGAQTGRIDPRRVLALTFTRKAAQELTGRLRSLGLRDAVAAGTFHGIAYATLRARWNEQGRAEPELLDRKVGFVARLLGRGASVQPIDVVTEIEWAKARRIGPRAFAAETARQGRVVPGDPEQMAEYYQRYEETKHRRRLIDFDDMLLLCRRELVDDADYGDAQRWRFRHVFVDEFQDVNPLQFSLLQAWLGPRTDLTVVGDPRQAIYGWNGADPAFLESFTEIFDGAHTVELHHNYRSSPQILAVANAVLRHGRALTPTRASGPLPVTHTYATDTAEAQGIVRTIRDRRGPSGRWADQAVLVRTNAQVPLIEEALRKAGVPFRARGGPGLLDRPEIKTLIRSLPSGQRLDVALADLEVDLAFTDDDDDLAEPGDSSVGAATVEERRAAMAQFVRFAHDHLALDGGATVGGFVSWLRASTSSDAGAAGGDAVEVATFHAAKGLEWPIVHIAGLEDGLAPIAYATTQAAQREERNLMYVAITRAEHELHLSWAEQRQLGRRASRRTPSPFLVAIEDALASVSEGAPVEDPQAHIEAQRLRLPSGRPDPHVIDLRDDLVLASLHSWRDRAARAADVAPGAVFADDTLRQVAADRPTSLAELASIPGIGPVKLARYGATLVDIVGETATPPASRL